MSARVRNWFGQPPGLTILFLTEMWEKFSFFGMRALLVYYMTKQLGFETARASMIYGIYAAFVYFTPIVGGWLADRYLGARRSVIIGSTIMVIGHGLMGFPELLYPALACIAIGSGLFLPSLPGQVMRLYELHDPRRGSAYNIYFVGINLGALAAPLVCGTLGELWGWHWGFGAAAIGMSLGTLLYAFGGRWLAPEPPPGPARQVPTPSGAAAPIKLLLVVGIAVVIFRGAYEQIGNTIALWADADVDRTIGGFTIPASWFQSVDPLLIFLLTPVAVAFWLRQAKRGNEPHAVGKMAIGAIGLAGAFLLVAAIAAFGGKAHWLWLMAFLFAFTASELFIIPVGLALFAQLAPEGRKSVTMAGWFFASFAGNLFAGFLGTFWGRIDHAVFFAAMAGLAALSSVLLFWLKGRLE
jgi:POT family proton-dependent oligopeptide transporter